MQTFPYSRHSSYTELCHLVEAFKPKDIWPCTVDKYNWSARQSMSFLFGHLYDSQCKFTHDQAMFQRIANKVVTSPEARLKSPGQESLPDVVVQKTDTRDLDSAKEKITLSPDSAAPGTVHEVAAQREQGSATIADSADEMPIQSTRKRRRSDVEITIASSLPGIRSGDHGEVIPLPSLLHSDKQGNAKSNVRMISPEDYSEAWKREAFEAALGTNPSDWNDITLVSVSGHQQHEEEL